MKKKIISGLNSLYSILYLGIVENFFTCFSKNTLRN